MRKEVILKYLGSVLLLDAFFLFISYIMSAILSESSDLPLLFSALICLFFGLSPLIFIEEKFEISFSEGISIVVFGWLITCLVGMLPYIMWGGEFTVINAWFESVSGFTTTGSTILNDIENLPKGLLFWRSSTHWIGGIGIIIFVLLILPYSTNTRLTLISVEISELSKSNFRYNARNTVKIITVVYVGLTLLETIALYLAGMNFFDAINHSFATIATGGFSTKNLSVAYFNSPIIEIIIMIFMVISGIHFGLIFSTVTFKKENIFNSPVVRAFVSLMIIGILLAALKLYAEGFYSWWESLRYASFQVVSVGSTTGFATEDTANWPAFAQIIIIYFTIQCAMVGSTSGGLKFDRVFIFIKSVGKQIKLIQHPRAVFSLKIKNININDQLERQVLLFISLYVFTFFITTVLLTFCDIDLITAFSASIATIGNVGPGLGGVSSLGNYSDIPGMGKLLLSINMLLGRLEIYNIIALIFLRRGGF